jgi:hypothetical protein
LFRFAVRQRRYDCGVGFTVGPKEGASDTVGTLVGDAEAFKVGDNDGDALGAADGDSINSVLVTVNVSPLALVTASTSRLGL